MNAATVQYNPEKTNHTICSPDYTYIINYRNTSFHYRNSLAYVTEMNAERYGSEWQFHVASNN